MTLIAQVLGTIKAAEIELAEAAIKACDGEKQTAMNCLLHARREIDNAAVALAAAFKEAPHGEGSEEV